jgi:DNA polymerase-3 subunit epsilon
MTSRFAVIDFETTGLSPDNGDRITEVAIVIVESEKIVDQFESLVNTGRSIPYEVQGLTGITNQMTANAPSASLIIPQIHQYVKNSTLIAHNGSFDSKFFRSEMSLVGIRTNVDFICTLLLSRRLYPNLDNHKLGTLAKYHGIKSQGKSHRALADALVTAELFIQISKDLKDHLSTENLTAHHYLRSQKQPLNSFSKSSKLSSASVTKPQSNVNKPFIKPSSQQSEQVKQPTTLIVNARLIKPPVAISEEIKNIDSRLQQHGIKIWIKTPTGLINKKTNLFISFTDTLRDVFPIPGYKVKGHKIEFIKDSEIGSLTVESVPTPHPNLNNPDKESPRTRFLAELDALEKRGQDSTKAAPAPTIQITNQTDKQERLWIKTPRGLYNKKTGNLISFADTLRDAFPISGYRVKGFPIEFIKDSEIDPN